MNASIVLDTSVWIDYLRGRPQLITPIEDLMTEQRLVGFGPVFAELLQGVRSKREKSIILGLYHNLPRYGAEDIWLSAGLLATENQFFTKGVGIIDAAIYAFARKNNLLICTFDKKLLSVVERQICFDIIKPGD